MKILYNKYDLNQSGFIQLEELYFLMVELLFYVDLRRYNYQAGRVSGVQKIAEIHV